MEEAADHASALLQSLGNRHRLLLLCYLAEGERTVGELASEIGIRDTNASQHLALLRREGLVQTRRDGQNVWYSIASEAAHRILLILFDIFCKPASAAGARAPARRSRSAAAVTRKKR